MDNKKKCHHGYELDANGQHIIPKNTAMPIGEVAKQYKDRLGYLHDIPQTERDKQLERDALQWKKYFEQNRGKIPNEFPKTIVDNVNTNTNINKNEVRKLSKFLDDR
ncbi:MAG: hypothetical protein ACRD97_04165 [Nitrososphaeraceae archaeon]